MRLERKGIFETNSSSTHALVIPHKVDEDNYSLNDSLDHDYSFGRGAYRLLDSYDEKIAYAYYVLFDGYERYEYCKEHPEDSYGYGFEITKENLEEFKRKINLAYERAKKLYKYNVCENDPKPDDLFLLIEAKDEIREFKNIKIKEFDEGFRKIVRSEYKRELTENEKEITQEYQEQLHSGEVIYLETLSEKEEQLTRLRNILPEHFSYYGSGVYVDHAWPYLENGFIQKMLEADVDYLLRFLFNSDSYITIGGDEYQGYNIKTIGFEYDYEEIWVNEKGEPIPKRTEDMSPEQWSKICESYDTIKSEFWDKLKEYEKENDVFLKGN